MSVFLNGQFVPEEKAVISVFDRSFLYGDGLFETLRVFGGKPFRWAQHIERLQRGVEFLKLRLPFAPEEIRQFADKLIHENRMPEALLRLSLSRGVGPRGYSPKGADQPMLIMTVHPAPVVDRKHPPQWTLATTSFRLRSDDPLSHFKTSNKLTQVLARSEAESAGADEALLLTVEGEVAEGASSNLFWMESDAVCSPPLASGILPGVTRAVVLEICQNLGIPVRDAKRKPDELRDAPGVFLSVTTLGLVEATHLDNFALKQSPLLGTLRAAYEELMRSECERKSFS